MNDFDKAEMKHDLDKAVLYYEECPKYCGCEECYKIEIDEGLE